MGCGKSATILRIAAYKYVERQINALLIIAPNMVHVQWAHTEITKWLNVPYQIQCYGGKGGSKRTYPFDRSIEGLHVVCTNIDTFSTKYNYVDIVDWANHNDTMIILDEAQKCKGVSALRTQRILYEFNMNSKRGKTIIATQSKSKARAVLTGTPVGNGPIDLWPIMEFAQPGFWGKNYWTFQQRYGMFTTLAVNDRIVRVPLTQEWWEAIKKCQTYGEAYAICGCSEDTFNVVHSQEEFSGPYKHADELKAKLDTVASFMKLTDCVNMPPVQTLTRQLVMSDAIAKAYMSMVEEYISEYEDHVMTASNKLSMMIRLQQLSSGFIMDRSFTHDPDNVDHVAELYGITNDELDITPPEIQWIGDTNPKLEAMYLDIESVDRPVIIVTRFSAEAARIYDDLSKDRKVCLMTGWKTVGSIADFQAGKYDAMVANIAVINAGFNLQNSHTMLYYSNTFSLIHRIQSEGRIYRIGQEMPCQYVDYVYGGTIDEKIVSALQLKRNLLDYIRDTNVVKELIL
jgi:SNF2 family DNA or RNA helicase